MRSTLLRSLAVIGAGGLILAGVLYVASTVDARPPEVLEVILTQPVGDDDRTALITTSLEIVFTEPVRAEGAADAVVLEPGVEGAVSWSGSTMIFTPSSPLELQTSYTLSVGPGIRDLAGNAMAELPPAFTFETAGRPTLVGSSPEDGADDVAPEGPIGLTFSTLMDTASVEGQLRLRPAFAHELRWSGELLEIVPTEPLRPGQRYEVTVQADAADVAGVALGEAVTVRFRTAAPGLTATTLVPADGINGIAPASSIAIFFDRPIDAATISADLLTITPEVAGSLELVAVPEDGATEAEANVLRFTPSAALPPNTTFEVELAPGIASTTGGGLAGPVSWSFTTGAPPGAISNQVTFVTDRAGVANVWAMNPDGTRQRQVSAELTPVLDYVVAPDGSSLVLSDGRRLVHLRADGSGRRVLTEDGLLEFDPAYAPDGQRIVFGRADAATGEGLGLFEWEIDGGAPAPIEIPDEPGEPIPSRPASTALRAPRFAPDGRTLAFVDLAGSLGLLDLVEESIARVPFRATAAPAWEPDSGALLLTGRRDETQPGDAVFEAPVVPFEPDEASTVYRLALGEAIPVATAISRGSRILAVRADGTLAYAAADGSLWLTDDPMAEQQEPVLEGERVAAAALAPGQASIVVVLAPDGEVGRVDLYEVDLRRRTPLVPEGSRPRWLP